MQRLRSLVLAAVTALGVTTVVAPATAAASPTYKFRVVGGQLDQKVVWESKSANTQYSNCYDLHGEDSGTTHYQMQPIKGDEVRFGDSADDYKLQGVKWAGSVSEHATRKEWYTLRKSAPSTCQNPPPEAPYARDKGCGFKNIKPGHSGLFVTTMSRHQGAWEFDSCGFFVLFGPFSKNLPFPHCYSYDEFTSTPILHRANSTRTDLYHLKVGERYKIEDRTTDDTVDALAYEFAYQHHGFHSGARLVADA